MTDWRARAACAGSDDPGGWFANPAAAPERVALAQATCRTCPVQENCLDEAMRLGEQHGIWGGLDPADRADLGLVAVSVESCADEGVRVSQERHRRGCLPAK